MRTMFRRVAPVALVAALLAVPVTTLAARQRASSAPHPVPAADWTTYHHDVLRTGDGVVHGTFTTLHPKVSWHLPAATPTDKIYASPLVIGTTAYVTTLQNRVYAISLTTGHQLWTRTLGAAYTQPSGVCGDIHPNVGIVSTPVIDEGRGELFVVATLGRGTGGTVPGHRLFGVSTATGRILLNRYVDPPGQQAVYLLQRVSLAIAKGRVVFGFGGNGGDCGTYHGWVISVPEYGTGVIDRYEVAAGPGQGRGAVWMGGAAPVVDRAGNVYVADGNGNATNATDAYDYSDAVLKLTPTMHLLDWFAPTTWYTDNLHDSDLGSSAPQLLPNGKLLAIGKTQTVYVLNPSNLGHIDGAVPTFPLCTEGAGGVAMGGDTIAGSLVVVACTNGLDAAAFSSSPPYGAKAWTQPLTNGPAVYAAGLLWSIGLVYPAHVKIGTGTLYGLDPATGNVKVQYVVGLVQNHFPTPAIGDNMVVVATDSSLLAFAPG